MKVYYKHSISPTCFGHACGPPQGNALQRTDTSNITEVSELMHIYKNMMS